MYVYMCIFGTIFITNHVYIYIICFLYMCINYFIIYTHSYASELAYKYIYIYTLILL